MQEMLNKKNIVKTIHKRLKQQKPGRGDKKISFGRG